MEKNYTSNSAAWESQMIYAEQERQQAIKAQQAKEAPKTQLEQPKNYNRSPSRKNNLMKGMAKVALAASLFGGLKAIHDHNEETSTVNNAISQVKFNDSSTYDLDVSPDKIEEYELLDDIAREGVKYSFELEPGEAIHTNTENYAGTYHPDYSPEHNALAQNVDDKKLYFEIKEGPIYKTPDGRIAVKSKNLEQTQLHEKTGIKFELDSDEWSVVDVSPFEVRLQNTNHTLDEVARNQVSDNVFERLKIENTNIVHPKESVESSNYNPEPIRTPDLKDSTSPDAPPDNTNTISRRSLP